MQALPLERVPKRFPALDGVRGIAAAVVVVHHALLTTPVFALPYTTDDVVGTPGDAAWWFTYTPLHLFWNGSAAVYLFFVLSGVVLTLPALQRGAAFNWGGYYVQRFIRLYLPVWAAVGMAALSIWAVPRSPQPSAWLTANVDPIWLNAVVNDLGLLTDRGYLASPLWSLHWEVVFSLLLPLFVWIAVQLKQHSVMLIPISLGAVAAGQYTGIPQLKFLPMFLIGSVIGLNVHRGVWGHAQGHRWSVIGALAATAISAPWVARAVDAGASTLALCEAAAVLSSALLLLAALQSPLLRGFFTSTPLQFLGRVSFSWYLVHEPLVIAAAFLSRGAAPLISIPSSILFSLGIAVLFHHVIERPSQRLARRAGRRPLALPTLLEFAGVTPPLREDILDKRSRPSSSENGPRIASRSESTITRSRWTRRIRKLTKAPLSHRFPNFEGPEDTKTAAQQPDQNIRTTTGLTDPMASHHP